LEEEENVLRQEIKICIPFYKMAYSLIFLAVLSLIRGIIYVDEIGIAMDANIGLLAAVFCAETYVMEQNGKRYEVFRLFPMKNKCRAIFRRLLVQNLYLCLISYIGYFFFYWQKPIEIYVSSEYSYCIYLIAVTGSCVFWSAFSMTMANLCRNQWAGIGISMVLWLLLNSKIGEQIWGNFNIFAYSFRNLSDAYDLSWLWGKGVGILLAICMIGMIPYILEKRG